MIGRSNFLPPPNIFGTLANVGGNLPPHAFQGTAGLTVGDLYIVTVKTTFDNIGKGTMTAL